MARIKSLFCEYYVVHALLLSGYAWFRHIHQDDEIDFPGVLSRADDFESLELHLAVPLALTAWLRHRKNATHDSLPGYVLQYAQLFVLIVTFLIDKVAFAYFLLAFFLAFLLLVEPSYDGPENVRTLTAAQFKEQCNASGNSDVSYIVYAYASWSSASKQKYPIFADLSVQYATDKVVFCKIDLGDWKLIAKELDIDLSAVSAQLPTVLCYEKGLEKTRVPSSKGSKAKKTEFTRASLIKELELDMRFTTTAGSSSKKSQ